jgi:hypothetical protein
MGFRLVESVDMLRRTPSVLREQVARSAQGWTDARKGADEWSARKVVCHLAYIEEQDWMVRTRMVVSEGATRPFPPVEHGDVSHRYPGVPTDEVADRFATLRARNLEELGRLVPDESGLDRVGLHPSLGTVTLRQLLATWVVHDLNHLAQLDAAMASRYASEVGPWKSFLGILDD